MQCHAGTCVDSYTTGVFRMTEALSWVQSSLARGPGRLLEPMAFAVVTLTLVGRADILQEAD